MHVLVTRPAPAATAARWAALGHVATVAPLLAIVARRWRPPARAPEAIALTSANGARLAGAGARAYHPLPTFVVGTATARAATAAGFTELRDGGGTVASLLAAAAAAGVARLLHLAGADRTAATVPPGLKVVVRTVYAAEALALTSEVRTLLAAGAIDLVPLYSARSAARFAAEVDTAGIDRAAVALAALSPAVAAAAGTGWRDLAVAAAPTDDALFAVARGLCDKPGC